MKKKPRIVIEPTGAPNRPYLFKVVWKGSHWKNSQWFTFDEALVAAGVKSLHELPSASNLFQSFAIGGDVQPGTVYYVGERPIDCLMPRKSHEA